MIEHFESSILQHHAHLNKRSVCCKCFGPGRMRAIFQAVATTVCTTQVQLEWPTVAYHDVIMPSLSGPGPTVIEDVIF